MAKARKARRKVRRRTRRNPTTTKGGRTLHPENCGPRQVQKIMHLRGKQRAQHKRQTRRIGKACTFQSAELALHQGRKARRAAGKKSRKPTRIRSTHVTRSSGGGSFAEWLDSKSGVRKYLASAR